MSPLRLLSSTRARVTSLAAFALVAGATPAAAQMSVDYVTLIGGVGQGAIPGSDWRDMDVDDAGCAYVLGYDGGQGLPEIVPGGAPCTQGPSSTTDPTPWVAKLDVDGTLLWSRFLGPTQVIQAHSLAVSPDGSAVYVGGWGHGGFAATFPTLGWDPTNAGGRDGYVCRLDGATGCLETLTFFGNPSGFAANHAVHGLTVDSTGAVHAVGWTGAPTYNPTAVLEGFLPTGGAAAFAVGFDATLTQRDYFVYLPCGDGEDMGTDVAVDDLGQVYVTGFVNTTDLTFTPAFIGPGGGTDCFFMKLDAGATQLMIAAWIGGSADEGFSHVAVDQGIVHVTGSTGSSDFFTTNGSSKSGQDDAFVMQLDAVTGAPLFSTYFGGSGDDQGTGIGVDDDGRAYVAGWTKSSNLPTPGGLVTSHGSAPSKSDGFLAQFETDGSLLAATFLGGNKVDSAGGGVVARGNGVAYVSGTELSNSFSPAPTIATQDTKGYTAKILFGPPPPDPPGITVAPTSGLVTTEAGGTDSFTVVLDTEPTAAVAIDVTTSDSSEGLVSSGAQGPAALVTLTFDGLDWDQPQTVTVTGQDDAVIDGNVAYALNTGPATSGDLDYAGLDADDVSATNTDDDAVAVTVTSIAPDTMDAGTSIGVTISGSAFAAGATVSFENGSGPAPSVSNLVVVGPSTITATLSVGNQGPKGARVWDVRVTNTDSSTGVLVDGFTVFK